MNRKEEFEYLVKAVQAYAQLVESEGKVGDLLVDEEEDKDCLRTEVMDKFSYLEGVLRDSVLDCLESVLDSPESSQELARRLATA